MINIDADIQKICRVINHQKNYDFLMSLGIAL